MSPRRSARSFTRNRRGPRLPAGTPATVRTVLQRCLEKDPKKRLRDISSVGLLLEEAPAAGGAGRARLLPWLVAGAAAVVAAVALLAPWRSTQVAQRPLVRLDVDLGSDVSLGSPQGTDVIISPDGNRLVFVSHGRLFTRRLDQPKAVELAGTAGSLRPVLLARWPVGRVFCGGTAQEDFGRRWSSRHPLRRPRWPRRQLERGWHHRRLAGRNHAVANSRRRRGAHKADGTGREERASIDGRRFFREARPCLLNVRTGGGTYDDGRIDVLSIPGRP